MRTRPIAEWVIFIAPLPVFLIGVYFMPLFDVISWSVTKPEVGLQNFADVAQRANIHQIALRTLRIGLTSTLIALVLAYFLAYHWVYGPPARRRVVEAAILIPFWISVLIRAFGWLLVLRPAGTINQTLEFLGMIERPLALVRNELGVTIGMVHFLVPFAVFPIASSMRQIDPRILLAARGMGSGPIRRFFEVFLPLTKPGLIGAFFIVFVFSLGFFVTPTLLGGGRVMMLAEYIFNQLLVTPNWGVATALSVMLLIFVAMLVLILSKLTRLDKLAG